MILRSVASDMRATTTTTWTPHTPMAPCTAAAAAAGGSGGNDADEDGRRVVTTATNWRCTCD